jgi:hypothetical protein
MHAGNGQLHQIDKSRQLQRKLYLAAKKCRERRFHALYDRIFRPDVVGELNPVVRGWRNYFSVGNSTKQLKALDHYLWLRTRRSFLAHHQGTRGLSKSAFFPSWFARSGVEHFYLPGLCGNDFERSRKKDNR